ncbi:MAG: hypothetical protein JNL34_07785 [Anaerolineae bacterium]|nr:hypothetical protein [Anaerolineae bacterium]
MSTPARPNERYELHLKTIGDLFAAPDSDPFDPDFLDVSGVDELVNILTPHILKHQRDIVIYLPPDQITPTLESETRAALDRFLTRRSRFAHNQVLAMRRQGIRSLGYALALTVIVLIPLVLAYTLDWPEIVQMLTYAAFLVVGWVAMWCAVEYLLFDWIASQRQANVLNYIRRCRLRILPAPGDKP